MSRQEAASLSDLIAASSGARRSIRLADRTLNFGDLCVSTSLGGYFEALRGRRVVLISGDQAQTAATLIELDGWASRIVICPPDLESRHIAAVARDSEADALVHDGRFPPPAPLAGSPLLVPIEPSPRPRATSRETAFTTQWALLTSGTTGDPKMVIHTLATLLHAVPRVSTAAEIENWATFYDIRRYGGLQMFLRGCAGNGSLTLRGADEPIDGFLARMAADGATHVAGTPAHWRLVLMNPARDRIDPKYARMSGEIADDSLLGAVASLYPRALVAHAYASTEAGVVFEIEDGRAGFPPRLLEKADRDVELKLVDGALRVRSPGMALGYLGAAAAALCDADGFVDTGDLIRLTEDRCYFAGRRGGVINIGGAKVHPEEVEAIINQHASVLSSLVSARKNPIAGFVVVADVVLRENVAETAALRNEILSACARDLAPFKVPAVLRFVADLAVTGAGKLARNARGAF
jgi:acyl-coenzyme A synthetase/AMP-(fatty) acid ligase